MRHVLFLKKHDYVTSMLTSGGGDLFFQILNSSFKSDLFYDYVTVSSSHIVELKPFLDLSCVFTSSAPNYFSLDSNR